MSKYFMNNIPDINKLMSMDKSTDNTQDNIQDNIQEKEEEEYIFKNTLANIDNPSTTKNSTEALQVFMESFLNTLNKVNNNTVVSDDFSSLIKELRVEVPCRIYRANDSDEMQISPLTLDDIRHQKIDSSNMGKIVLKINSNFNM